MTELIDSPYLARLTRERGRDFPEDVTDLTEVFIGGAVHDAVDSHAGGRAEHERLVVVEVAGRTVKGAVDVFANKTIWDVKTWAASQRAFVLEGDFRSAEKQLNVYAELFRMKGEEVNALKILVPWKRMSAQPRSEKDPPYSPEVFDVPMWEPAYANAYLLKRLELHSRAAVARDVNDIPACTPEERWFLRGGWAVKANNVSRAYRVFDSAPEAEALAKEMNAAQASKAPSKRKFYTFSERPNVYRRCNTCRFRPICKEYAHEQ